MDEIESVALKPGEKLFGQGARGGRTVAVMWSKWADETHYTLGFKEAADAMIARGIESRAQDLVPFPSLYCYRHALELVLKELIYMGQKLRYEPRTIWHTHSLTTLWPLARAVISEAFESDEDVAQLDALEAVVIELAAIDFNGELFRYSHDKDGTTRTIPPELERVDLAHVAGVMRKAFGLLFGSMDGVGALIDAMPDYGDVY